MRSEIREDQVKDSDFLSPYEHDHETIHYFIKEGDTPTTYSGHAGEYVKVKSSVDGLEFSEGSYIPETWVEVSSNYAASAGDNLMLNSTVSGIVVTLPSSPSLGNTVKFIDGAGNCATYNVTVSGSGEKIAGSTDPLIVDTNDANFYLVYYNSTYGWKLGVHVIKD